MRKMCFNCQDILKEYYHKKRGGGGGKGRNEEKTIHGERMGGKPQVQWKLTKGRFTV